MICNGFIEKTKTTIAALEGEIANLKSKSVDLESISHYVEISMRLEAVNIGSAIRNGDYGV